MLCEWADYIILAGVDTSSIKASWGSKVKTFLPDGPDIYKRPFNPELDDLVKQYLEENKGWLKS